MRLLLMKTSSLGDVIHNLPVVSDIKRHFPDATVDWCVEENFAAIPRLHPGVNKVIPVALRRWRKRLLSPATWREMAASKAQLQANTYDLVIDTQGLAKSALLSRLCHGVVAGYDADSAREPYAARHYQKKFSIAKSAHAVTRNRQLVATALGYSDDTAPDYGITAASTAAAWLAAKKYVVLLTATSRDDKLWPETHWIALGQSLLAQGLQLVFPSGNARERERAQRLAAALPGAIVAPPLQIPELASLLAGAAAVVGVDTGLTHLAVALKTPTIALYTATDPGLTGVFGTGYLRNLGGKAQQPSPDDVLAALASPLAPNT